MRRTIALTVALHVASVIALGAHGQTIRGLLVSEPSGEAVAGAEVTLLDTLEQPIRGVRTNESGAFIFEVEPGQFAFRVLRVGHAATLTERFAVSGNTDTLRVTIKVPSAAAVEREEPIALAPVIVEGISVARHLQSFERRRVVGFGDFVVRDEFERWNARDATDIVRRMPSFYVTGNPTYGSIRPDGSIDTRQNRILVSTMSHRRGNSDFECPPLVYLDGASIGDSRSFDIADIPIAAIEAVETYSRPALVPPEFNRAGSSCGVIALWTRTGSGDAATHRFEIGARYGGSIAHGDFGWGRLGVHFVMPFIGPVEFYPAFHLMVNIPAADDGGSNSGWQAQLAVRIWPVGREIPWYVGTGMLVTKQYRTYSSLIPNELAEPDAAYTLLTGAALRLGPLRPFAEVHVLDVFTFSNPEIQVMSGVGFQF